MAVEHPLSLVGWAETALESQDLRPAHHHRLLLEHLEAVATGTIDRLMIAGERTLPDELRKAIIHRLELPYGYFERRVPLPTGRYDQIRHRAQDGLLIVSLRKLA